MTIFVDPARAGYFIPEIWTSGIWMELRNALIVGSSTVVNRQYEGEIKAAGDKVKIPTVLDPEIEDYDPVTGFADDIQDITGASKGFEITESKAFRFKVDDVAAVQSLIGGQYMNEGIARAARKLAEAADGFVAGLLKAKAQHKLTLNMAGSTNLATPDITYKKFIDVKVALDKTNTPFAGRYAIITPELHGLLLLDPRFTDVSKFGSNEPIRDGVVGRFAGFEILPCNQMPTLTHVIAGHNIATTFADQIVQTEAYRPERWFADAVRGLHVYGADVMRPEHVAVVTEDPAA